jgi:hypothetical protein
MVTTQISEIIVDRTVLSPFLNYIIRYSAVICPFVLIRDERIIAWASVNVHSPTSFCTRFSTESFEGSSSKYENGVGDVSKTMTIPYG